VSELKNIDYERPVTVTELTNLLVPIMKSIAETGSALMANIKGDHDEVRHHMNAVLGSLMEVRDTAAKMVGVTPEDQNND
jgi:hypothetical protein